MSVSDIASKNSILEMLWLTSLALALISSAIMLVLVLRHIIIQHRKAKIFARKKQLDRFLFAAINSPIEIDSKAIPNLSSGDYPILMRSALNIIRSLNGNDAAKIIKILNLCNIKPYLLLTAQKGAKGKRIQSLTLLGYFSNKDSLQFLLNYVNDEDIAIQISALRALSLHDSKKHLRRIIKSLTNSHKTNVILLADVLRRFGDFVVKDLIDVLNAKSNTDVKIAIIIALGDIGSLEAVDDLIKFAASSNLDIRTESIISIGKIGDQKAAPIIAENLQHKSAKVRIESAKSLGNLQAESTLPILVESLNDKNWWVRFYAAQSIYKFQDKGIAILKSISSQEDEAGLICAEVLAEFKEGF